MAQRVRACVRRRNRYPVDINALVYRCGGGPAPVRLTDFSDQGCRIQGVGDFHIGERLQISIPRMGQIKAQVRWIAAKATGVRFVTESDF